MLEVYAQLRNSGKSRKKSIKKFIVVLKYDRQALDLFLGQ